MATAKGWPVKPEYIFNEGIIGTKDATGRPALTALVDAVRKKAVQAVIVLALDCLGRKTRIVLELVEQITGAGTQLVSWKESLDISTPPAPRTARWRGLVSSKRAKRSY